MGETINQRVNALFAAYVANELEQDRLGRAGDDAGAQALCAPTIAIREKVFAIRDRTGCADLIAARLLLDLMLVTRWNADGGPEIGFEDQENVLPLLETLADSTTGAVRQQAAKALATIGVHVAPETADPMLALVSEYRRLHESLSGIPDDDEADRQWTEILSPIWDKLTQAPPSPTTNAGAAAAIRLVRDESRGSYAPDLIASVLTATADALDERAGTIITQPDPLALLLADYREALDAHNAADLPDDVAEEAHAAATYRPLYERIETNCPTPTTLAGVREAVRLALNREMGDTMPAFAESLLRAALAHLEGGTAGGLGMAGQNAVEAAIQRHLSIVEHDETLFNDEGDAIASASEIAASDTRLASAWMDLMAAPCLSLEDVRAKVDYVMNGTLGERDLILFDLTGPDWSSTYAADNCLPTFLRSLLGESPMERSA